MSNDPLRDALSAGLPPQARQPAAPTGGTRATRNNNPGNLEDGPFAKSQPGYKGSDGRFAIFETPEAGRNAQLTKLDSLVQKGYNTPLKLATIWAPPSENNTAAYAKHIADNLGIGANDPIPAGSLTKIAAAQGQIEGYNGPDALAPEYQPDPKDPLRNALAGGNGAPDAALPDQRNVQPDTLQRTSADNVNISVLAGGEAPQAAGSPAQSQTFGKTLAQGVSDLYTGVGEGWNDLQNGIVGLGTRATDALGLTTGAHDNYNRALGQIEQDNQGAYYTPSGWARATGKFAGNAAALAPLAEVKPLAGLTDASKASLLAKGILKYGDYAAQGGLAGTLMSGGNNIAQNAAIGAAGAPVLGAVAEHAALPLLLKGGKMVTDAAGKGADLAKSIMDRVKTSGEMTADEIPAKPAWMDNGDWVTDPQTGVMTNTKTGEHGMSVEVTDDSGAPSSVTPDQLGAAIGNRADKNSILATTDLPPQVAQRFQQLTDQGVPEAEALRQADIEGVGAAPDVASVRRSPGDMRARNTASQLSTPEGTALAQQLADNNAALHSTAKGMVEANGGTVAPGDAASAASDSLSAASQAERKAVNAKYQAAREADPTAQIKPTNLQDLLNSDEAKQLVPGTPEYAVLEQARNAVKGNGGEAGMQPEAIDKIAQAANRKYGPDKAVNYWVKQVSEATAKDLDQLDSMGPLWRDARAAHRAWAEKYQDPAGVRKIIANDGNWEATEKAMLGGGMKESDFLQTVDRLKANGDTNTLNKLKASVIQNAWEAAGGKGAADMSGNQAFSGQKWADALDKIGRKRLEALFSPEELAQMAHVGRTGIHINEQIPGTFNPSGTAQMVAELARKQGARVPGKARAALDILAGGLGYLTHGVEGVPFGPLLAEQTRSVAESLYNQRNSAKLAKVLQDFMNPDNARAAEAMRAMSEAEKQRIRDLSRMLAARSAPAAGADRNRSQ